MARAKESRPPRYSGVSFTHDSVEGGWTAELVIFTSLTEFHRVFVEAPTQTFCKEAALSLLKPSIWGHKATRSE